MPHLSDNVFLPSLNLKVLIQKRIFRHDHEYLIKEIHFIIDVRFHSKVVGVMGCVLAEEWCRSHRFFVDSLLNLRIRNQ